MVDDLRIDARNAGAFACRPDLCDFRLSFRKRGELQNEVFPGGNMEREGRYRMPSLQQRKVVKLLDGRFSVDIINFHENPPDAGFRSIPAILPHGGDTGIPALFFIALPRTIKSYRRKKINRKNKFSEISTENLSHGRGTLSAEGLALFVFSEAGCGIES